MKNDKEILRKFGNRLRMLRKEKGIQSQIDLAMRTGLDRTYIGGIERGERNLSLLNIAKIAKALNLDIRDLF